MLTEYNVLKPDVPRNGSIVEESLLPYWVERKFQQELDWEPYEINVRFISDPLWRDQLWSIQCAHDATAEMGKDFDMTKPAHWFWMSMWGLAIFADLAWYTLRMWY